MFICQVTGKYSRQGRPETETDNAIPGEKLEKIVVATRERIYTRKVRNEETGKLEEIEIGRGWEVVKEINASAEGLARWNAMTSEQKAAFAKHV